MHTFPSDKQPLLQVTQGDTKVWKQNLSVFIPSE
jgi:hypothetical protein